MINFLKAIEGHKANIKIIKIGLQEITLVKRIVISHLKLKNENELRDKFEGVAFYENFLIKASGIMALEKMINKNLLNWEKTVPKNFVPTVQINKRKIHVITRDFGDFPINIENTECPSIIFTRKDTRTLWLLGIMESNKEINSKSLSDFSQLTIFQNLKELEEVLD